MSDKPIHGIDMTEAMARLLGNRGLLIKVINGLHEEMLQDQDKFEAKIGANDFSAAAAQAHRCKGVAANISAIALYQHLVNCEAACKENNGELALEEFTRAVSEISATFASITE